MLFVNSTQESTAGGPDAPAEENAPLTEAEVALAAFWPNVSDEIKRIKTVDAKNQVLPLARIKKIMKLDEDVKMISAEAPLLFAKAAEIFIHELTLRAWVHTENNKRRTLQRNDIAMAITKFDQFDFLIDIVPREELKPVRKEVPAKPTVNCDQVQYYLQLAQQHQQALQSGTPTTNNCAPTTSNQVIPTTILQGQSTAPISLSTGTTPQGILMANPAQQIPSVVGNLSNIQQNQQQQQPIQLIQQIVTANGEIQHVPISIPQNQLNLIRMQVQNQANQQPILIQAGNIHNQPQILQMAQNPATSGVYINAPQNQTDD